MEYMEVSLDSLDLRVKGILSSPAGGECWGWAGLGLGWGLGWGRDWVWGWDWGWVWGQGWFYVLVWVWGLI